LLILIESLLTLTIESQYWNNLYNLKEVSWYFEFNTQSLTCGVITRCNTEPDELYSLLDHASYVD